MRIFIIDDEPKIRRGLANIITNYYPNWPVPLTAVSAEEALENPGLMEADILFLDIQLPGMSGLDLLQILRSKRERELQVIVISGYADFTYAQKCLHLCAKDYLLKPVDIHKLRQILDDAEKDNQDIQNQKRELQLVNSKLHNLRREFFSSVFFGTCQYTGEDYGNYLQALELFDSAYAVLLFQSDRSGSEEDFADYKYSFVNHLKSALPQNPDTYLTGTVDSVASVFIWKDYRSEQAAKDICAAQDIANSHFFKTGVSAVHFSFSELLISYQEAQKGLQKSRHESAPVVLTQDQTNYVEIIVKKRTSYHPVIQGAIQFVMEHYSSQVRIEQIASTVYVNCNYLSDLFKHETGENLSIFITDYRLYQAKKKLRKLENKVFMISEQVGFSDQHYFSQVFKKRVGITPQKYRSLYFGMNCDSNIAADENIYF